MLDSPGFRINVDYRKNLAMAEVRAQQAVFGRDGYFHIVFSIFFAVQTAFLLNFLVFIASNSICTLRQMSSIVARFSPEAIAV